jgi:23S rRNA (uracil1939-C5)-methyltransferase
VTSLAAGGAGIGRLPDGRVVFIDGAIPGDRAEIEVTEQRKDFARATVVSVLERSAGRIEPPCPQVAHGCGGCGWQHVEPVAAAEWKTDIVLDALRRIGQIRRDVETLAPVSVPPDGYRTTARFGVLADGSLGYHRRRSEELVGVDHCPVTHPRLDELVGAIRVTGASSVTLRVGLAGGERLAILPTGPDGRQRGRAGPGETGRGGTGRRGRQGRTGEGGNPWGRSPQRGEKVAPLPEFGADSAPHTRVKSASNIGSAANGATNGEARGPRQATPRVEAPQGVVVVAGRHDRACLHESAGGRNWRVSARSFFQSGPAAAEVLLDAVDAAVGDALSRGERLVDVYAGVGLLGGVMAARRGPTLVAVESFGSAAADARVNLADLDAEVVHAEVGRWHPSPADVVIADPARPGLGRPGVAAVVATQARRIVVVSCDPASLGRDAGLLAAEGYHPVTVQVTDLFPRTPHVEVVTRFDRS